MVTEVEFIDKRFRELVSGDATIHHLATGFLFTEGPVQYSSAIFLIDVSFVIKAWMRVQFLVPFAMKVGQTD